MAHDLWTQFVLDYPRTDVWLKDRVLPRDPRSAFDILASCHGSVVAWRVAEVCHQGLWADWFESAQDTFCHGQPNAHLVSGDRVRIEVEPQQIVLSKQFRVIEVTDAGPPIEMESRTLYLRYTLPTRQRPNSRWVQGDWALTDPFHSIPLRRRCACK